MSKGNQKRKGKTNTEVTSKKQKRDIPSTSTKMSNEDIISAITGEKCIKDDEPILVEDYIENPMTEEEEISNTSISSLPKEKVSSNPNYLTNELIKAIREFNSSCQKLSIDFDKERISFKGTDDSIYHVIDFEGTELTSYTFDRKNIIDMTMGIKT